MDYCDTCKRMEMALSRLRQIIKRLRQSGSTSTDDIQSNDQVVTEIEQELREHKSHASDSQTFYRETIEVYRYVEADSITGGKSITHSGRRGASYKKACLYFNSKC